MELAKNLRAKGMIYDAFLPFITSSKKEVQGLLNQGVFKVVKAKNVPPGTRVFGSQFVNYVKDETTDSSYKKSCLVVQAHYDSRKKGILTQSLTIQRASQRLILCLATSMATDRGLYIRDISQMYIQSTTKLNCPFYVRPLKELEMQSQLL
jgi:hypothetical protein